MNKWNHLKNPSQELNFFFVLGSYERLEGKIRKCLFFYVIKYSKITVPPFLNINRRYNKWHMHQVLRYFQPWHSLKLTLFDMVNLFQWFSNGLYSLSSKYVVAKLGWKSLPKVHLEFYCSYQTSRRAKGAVTNYVDKTR